MFYRSVKNIIETHLILASLWIVDDLIFRRELERLLECSVGGYQT